MVYGGFADSAEPAWVVVCLYICCLHTSLSQSPQAVRHVHERVQAAGPAQALHTLLDCTPPTGLCPLCTDATGKGDISLPAVQELAELICSDPKPAGRRIWQDVEAGATQAQVRQARQATPLVLAARPL